MYRQKRNPYPSTQEWLDEKFWGITRNDWLLWGLLLAACAIMVMEKWSWIKFWFFGIQ